MKKTILASIIGLIAITGSVFADDDCGLVVGKSLEGTMQHYQTFSYKTVISEAAFRQALINLKAYCCTKVRSCKDEKDKIKEKPYPPSAYFFDHLFDVTMRRLDGVQSLAYGVEVDPAGKAWREYINQVASDPNGTQAMKLESTYTGYRTLHTKTTKNLDDVIARFSNTNSETLSLGDKYNKVCELMKVIYESFQDQPIIIWSKFETKSFFRKCDNLVAYRVSRENSYVKLLMIKKSTQLLSNTTQAYTKTYFVEEKLMALRSLISKVKDAFQTVVQQAAASKSCSQ